MKPQKGKILIIDDEDRLRKALSRIMELEGFEIFQAATAAAGFKVLKEVPGIHLVICDVKLPDRNGIAVLEEIKSEKLSPEVILLTAFGTIHDGVYAMKQGAFDYITKGDGDEQILVSAEKAVEKAKLQERVLELEDRLETRFSFDRILGSSQMIKQAVNLAKKVAPTDSTVLLEGETGTGKELFAQSIHNAGPRKNKAFVAVNCSAFPKELLESEIFGHKKGAFTGAAYDKKGLFEEAHEGTLFLDEIGEMHPDLQAKLLRVLEEQSFVKVGDTRPTRVNVRIIAATNLDLLRESENDNFRSDLYYRLSVFRIRIPSLRERKEDIPAMVENFVKVYAAKTNKKIYSVNEDFLESLKKYHWPGNTRELKNVVERAVILADRDYLSSDLLPAEILLPARNTQYGEYLSLEEMEKVHIAKMLVHTGGNKTKAAEMLGIGVPTLYRKIEQYNLSGKDGSISK